MATPHVTGLAAALWAKNPEMTADEVTKRIENTVDVLPQLHGAIATSGRINVKRALAGDGNPTGLKIYEEIPKVVESAHGPNLSEVESMTKLTAEGAKEVTVCFDNINLDENMDWIEIMGADYRVRDTMTGTYEAESFRGEKDLCAAPVLGDTVYIRWMNQGSAGGPQGFKTKFLRVLH
jgi:hypothetical protein